MTRVVVEQAGARRTGASLRPTLASSARTLDISVRFLAQSWLGRGNLASAQYLLQGWAEDVFRYAHATLRVRGEENIEANTPYVVMSNHASYIDIPALIATYPGALRMVAKQELMQVPIWGRAMQASGFIPIDRRRRDKAIEQLEVAKQRLREGVAVWIAPEGTRSEGPVLGRFKKGGFHLAAQLSARILPAFIDGASTLMPKGRVRVHPGAEVTVTYGTPIPSGGDLAEEMANVRGAILGLAGGRLADAG